MATPNFTVIRPIRERSVDSLAIASLFTTTGLLLQPFQNTPFVDDWVYAWPVEHLLNTGELRILEYSGTINLPQVFWAAIFTLPYGFSFSALRVSTFVIAILSLCGLYLVLRELGASRTSALLGVAILAVYPIFFILSFTFMTDLPFVACMIAGSLAFVYALRYESTAWLTVAAVFISFTIAMRFTGIAVGVAFGMVLLFHAGGWGRQRVWLALLPPAFTVLLIVWREGHMLLPDNTWIGPASRLGRLEYAFPLLPEMTVVTLAFLSSAVGLALLPLATALLNRKNVQRAAPLFAIMVVSFVLAYGASIDFPLPLVPTRSMWTLDELGLTMPLVPGFTPFTAPEWVYWSLCGLGWASMSILIASLIHRPSVTDWFFLWSIFFGAAMVAVLWLFHDRYALPIVVPFIILAAREVQTARWLWAAPVVLVFAMISTFQTRDHLNYNAALYSALDSLRAMGAASSEINGGYAMNGWNQYAHPENAPRDRFGAIYVPWINSNSQLNYEISNSRSADAKVLATIPYKKWIGPSGNVYVLDRALSAP